MPDYLGSVGVKTERDDDVKIILVDGASGSTATKKLNINANGEAVSVGANDNGIPVLGVDADGKWRVIKLANDGTVQIAGAVTIPHLAFADDKVDVSGSSVTIPHLAFADDKVDVSGSSVTIPNLTFATDSVDVSGSSVTIPHLTFADDAIDVSGSSVTIPHLAFADDKVDVSGSSVSITGTVNVAIVPNSTGVVNDYETATITNASSHNYDYVVTSGKKFVGLQVLVGSSAKSFVQVGTWNGSAFTVLMSYWQQPALNIPVPIPGITLLGNGTDAIRVVVSNKDGGPTDVGVAIQGTEI